jgi:hypothetical protein
MKRTHPVLVLAALTMALPALAHNRLVTAGGSPYFQSDYGNVSVLYNDGIRPGMTNANGQTVVTTSSNPIAALQAAVDSWSKVDFSRIRFTPLAPTPFSNDLNDLRSIMTFVDSPEIRSLVGDAAAVTLVRTLPSTGEVLDADILFSPSLADTALPFSTNGAPNTIDLQAVATHELGHLLGAGHSHLWAATMFPFTGKFLGRTLSSDGKLHQPPAHPTASHKCAGP